MKILCEAGLEVCALNSGPRTESGRRLSQSPPSLRPEIPRLWRSLSSRAKPHQEPYSVEESEYSEGRDLFEHDVAYSNAPGTDWYWKRCKATGGKANFWGRSSARFGDIDFKAADLDGFGENWPVDYAEISPWFSKAERYMGVASTIQNRAQQSGRRVSAAHAMALSLTTSLQKGPRKSAFRTCPTAAPN